MIYTLPTSVTVNGREYEVNSDFRCILDIFEVLSDNDLTDRERGFLALGFFYPDLNDMPPRDYDEAVKMLYWFINGGQEAVSKGKNGPRLMDWSQDYPYIIGPVNKAIGHEIRGDAYLHWWTFLSAYMDIGDCLFAQIIRIRQLIAEGKKLEKADRIWYQKNRDLVDLKETAKYTSEELEFLRSFEGGG